MIHTDHLLVKNGSILICPPAVSSGRKSSMDEVFDIKRVASLRFIMEALIVVCEIFYV